MRYLKDMRKLITMALREDIGSGDITTESFIPSNRRKKARIIAKERAVLAGAEAIKTIFSIVDQRVKVKLYKHDGEFVDRGDVVCTMVGPVYSILKAERIALNYISYLSGISTLTHKYVERIQGTGARIYDTRKTTPGYRFLEKYAVTKGGGCNQRVGLYDQVLIKDNHIAALTQKEYKNFPRLIMRVRKKIPRSMRIQVEVDSLEQLKMVLPCHPDMILLDNMNPPVLRKALHMIRQECQRSYVSIETEASGGITLRNVRKFALLGVNRISIGALTHSAHNIDFSLEVEAAS